MTGVFILVGFDMKNSFKQAQLKQLQCLRNTISRIQVRICLYYMQSALNELPLCRQNSFLNELNSDLLEIDNRTLQLSETIKNSFI